MDVYKEYTELEEINDAIISKQKEYIVELEQHIEELHALIKKHLITTNEKNN
jgi:hypothetical protein